MNPIEKLHSLGQSIWYDNIERRLLLNGGLAKMVQAGEIRGVTSNPSIFNNAIANSTDYDDALIPLALNGATAGEIYESLAVEDIKRACDIFRDMYDDTNGGDGYVSLEVSPYLAHDSDGTIEEALRLWTWVDRPNLMIKIPATKKGLPAISASISKGINVNVTLIFSIQRYKEVMDAFITGLEQRVLDGKKIDHIASVASFFISRIDSYVDERLNSLNDHEASTIMGNVAIANAKLAFADHQSLFSSNRWKILERVGGKAQRPLWASTSTKNPAYPDTKYVDGLIGPNTVNTIPPATLKAFSDHGEAALTLESGLDEAQTTMDTLQGLGVSIDEVTQELEEAGVKSFADAFTSLLDTIKFRKNKIS